VILDGFYGYAHELTSSSKLMTVALSKGDITAARAAYHQMSENGKSAVMTQYLMYKIALQENDVELGKQSTLTHQAHS
jgi:DNA-binding SARP family transcriptional activator